MIQIHGREQILHRVKAGSWVHSQHCSFANTFANVNSRCALCAVQFMAENTHFSSKHFIYSHGGQLSWWTQSNSKWQTEKHKIKLERGVERACVGWRRTRWATLRYACHRVRGRTWWDVQWFWSRASLSSASLVVSWRLREWNQRRKENVRALSMSVLRMPLLNPKELMLLLRTYSEELLPVQRC